MDDTLLIGLIVFGGGIILIIIAFAFYKKSDLGKSLMLMYIMQKHGPNSIVTIDLLQDIIHKMLAKDGVEVSDISLVHEMGNRYHGILSANGETHEMTVIADNSGALHYQLLN